ncbi:DUF2264 domain-containing protein [Kitasatospora phosalacinea]|uniref:DUF2264 domain-containing protein n=1 Tax=Kitasatospora phosalacinea TaxID=2065 RepID=UPI000525D326|nr:DUF2264 domain-containing protein [Kitasatospora phosalacinea]
MPLALPPEDRDRSPFTGWTRDHWVALAERLLGALAPHRSPGGALIALPGPASRYGRTSDGLEGFARTFLTAGFLVAGNRGAGAERIMEPFARGLAAGTDRRSPDAWPRPDELDQAKVEAASIALALQLTRPWLWDRLDDGVRERTVDWLASVIGQQYPPINWVWFRIVVESFLREVGGPYSTADLRGDLAVHATFHRPGGWLSDGAERSYDHYTGWALHLYPLLWTSVFDVPEDLCPGPVRERWRQDLGQYLDDAVRLIGSNGSPLLQGRSLTYRFAAAAPFWTGALAGAGSLSPGLIRRAAGGMVRHFTDRGAFEPDGLLTLGWHRPWPAIRQSYSGSGSPYWASKGLLGLLLPAEHPVWTAVEEPLPGERAPVARVIAAPGWLLSSRPADGIAVVLNHGTDHALPGDTSADSPLYARLGYSTATLPPLTGATVSDPVDNSVVVLDADDRATHRTGFTTLFTQDLPHGVLAAASRGRVRWVDTSQDTSPDHGSGRRGPVRPGPVLTVASIVRGGVEVRLARLDLPPGVDAPDPDWHAVRLGGWPIAGDRAPATRTDATQHAEAAAPRLHSRLWGLHGFVRAGVHAEQGTSPLGEQVAVPWLATASPAPVGELLAAVVVLDRGGDQALPRLEVLPPAQGHQRTTVVWADGLSTELTLPVAP